MIRNFTLALALSAFLAMPALAQTHSHADVQAHILAHMQSHTHAHGHSAAMHDSLMKLHGHAPHDTLMVAHHHAMMTAIANELVGKWSGTLLTSPSSPSHMQISIARDSSWRAALSIGTGATQHAATATNVRVVGPMITWTQNLEGKQCVASAMLAVQEAHPDGTLNGTLACGGDIRSFSARKETGRQ